MMARIKTGLFRLWIVLSVSWVLLVGAASFSPARDALAQDTESAAASQQAVKDAQLSPRALAEKNHPGNPYNQFLSDKPPPPDPFARFDPAPSHTFWPLVESQANVALAPPVAALAFGWAVLWAIGGFLGPRPTR